MQRIFWLAAATLIVAACSSGPPTPGDPRAFEAVCDKSDDGKRIAVEGYLRLPETIEVITNRRGGDSTQLLVVRLFQSQTFNGTPIGVNFDFGSSANTIDQLPTPQYTDKDLKVHLADGGTASYGQRVRISGAVYFPVTALTNADVDFTCGLDNPLVEVL